MNYNFNQLVTNVDERLCKDDSYRLDSSKIRKFLKWNDEIDLEKGIGRVVNWVEDNYQFLKNISLEYKHKK